MNNIVICDTTTPKGRNACFNNIEAILLPHAVNIVISKAIKEPPHRKPERDDEDEDEHEDEDEDEDEEGSVVDKHDFLTRLQHDNIWCKIFTNKNIFGDELGNIMKIKRIYGGNFERYTTFYEYDGCIGFTIRFVPQVANNNFRVGSKSTQEIYVLLQHKCEPITKHSNFIKLVSDIQPVLNKLHGAGFVHLDIKPDNIVLCGVTFKLIDYGNMQEGSTFVRCENSALTKIEKMVNSGRKFDGGRRRRTTRKLQKINNSKKRKTQYKKRK